MAVVEESEGEGVDDSGSRKWYVKNSVSFWTTIGLRLQSTGNAQNYITCPSRFTLKAFLSLGSMAKE